VTAPLRVQLLGPVRAWRGDQEVDLGSAGRRVVFAILALAAGRAVTREELVDGIWGEDPPARAVGVLHTYVSDLRRSLQEPVRRGRQSADHVLDSVGSAYALRVDREQLDVTRFDELRTSAEDLGGQLRAVTAALELWQGEALSGLAGPFAELHRARLGELRLATLERRCALLLALGSQDTAIAELTGLARKHPRREGLHGLLMVALYRAGRRDDALAEYESARQFLVTELGLDPGPALQDIHDRIVAQQKVPIPGIGSRHEQLATSTRQPEAPAQFVGRQREVAWLRALVVALADGAGGIGYFLKDSVFNADQFIDALERVADGGTAMDSAVISKLLSSGSSNRRLEGLTEREYSVLSLMAEGLSNHAIGQRLFLSNSAISKYTSSMFGKLGITDDDNNNRRVLAVLAYLNTL